MKKMDSKRKKVASKRRSAATVGMRRFGWHLQELRSVDMGLLESAMRRRVGPLPRKDDGSAWVRLDDLIPGTHLGQQRLARNLGLRTHTVREVAAALGISKTTLSQYETGKKYPSAEFVFDFCAVVGKPAEPAIREWVKNHPNPNVAQHIEFGHFNRFFGKKTLVERPNLPDPEVVSFLETVVACAVKMMGIRLGPEEAWDLVRAVTMLIDLTLLEGKGLNRRELKSLIDAVINPD